MLPGIIITSKEKYEAELAKRAMETCEQISDAMGAEVHDDLIQKLTVFGLNIDRLERSIRPSDEAGELLIKMRNDFQELIASVRRISRRLMPDILEGDSFTRSIQLLCENLELPAQGLVHFASEGNETEIPATTKKYLHRITQELVHNAFKNSSAWHVWVRLNWKVDRLIIEVEDDGTAFSSLPQQISKLNSKNNTLKMRSRAIGSEITYLQGEKGLVARVTIIVAGQ